MSIRSTFDLLLPFFLLFSSIQTQVHGQSLASLKGNYGITTAAVYPPFITEAPKLNVAPLELLKKRSLATCGYVSGNSSRPADFKQDLGTHIPC